MYINGIGQQIKFDQRNKLLQVYIIGLNIMMPTNFFLNCPINVFILYWKVSKSNYCDSISVEKLQTRLYKKTQKNLDRYLMISNDE